MLKSYLSKFLAMAVLMTCSFCLVAQTDATFTVASGDAAGDYPAIQAVTFGAAISDDITAPMSFVIDTDTLTTACVPIDMDLTGTIALVDRGGCAFTTKALGAQTAGAVAVIVCNSNQDTPDQAIGMQGDDMGAVTIPAVMVSFNICQAIRMGDTGSMATLSSTTNLVVGDVCDDPIVITPGDHTATGINANYSTIFNDAANALWYSYTPTADNAATVTSCGHATDTRVTIVSGTDCSLADAVVVAQNDDCDFDNSVFSSELTFIAEAGVRYWIVWDDRWSADGFDFTLSEGALPMVDIEVTVDMRDEEVAAEGVFLAGSHNGWMDGAMTDNGDGTWTGVISATTLDTVQYKFKNGPDGWETSADLAACGVDDSNGGFNRAFIAPSTSGAIATVCFNSCETCPVLESCPVWINENFDGLELGGLSNQSVDFTTWTPGSASEDAVVTDAVAASGTQSMLISEADPDDQLLLLGNRTEGNFILKWKMYVPSGSAAYYNLQKDEVPQTEFGREVNFNVDGTGDYGGDAFTFPHDTWFEAHHSYDIDNNLATVMYNGQMVGQHPIAEEAGDLNQLGSIDFFGNAGSLYYVDDVVFLEVTNCEEGDVCLNANDISGLFGQGQNNVQTSTIYDNTGYNVEGDPADGYECFGEPDGTATGPTLENTIWFSFEGDGQTYFITTVNCDGVTDYINDGDTQIAIYSGACDAPVAVACNEDDPNRPPNEFPAGLEFVTEVGTTYYMMIDGFDATALGGGPSDGEFCISVNQLTSSGDACVNANDINGLFGQGLDNVQTSSIYDNTGYDNVGDPVDGYECFGEPDGGAATPTLENTIWFTFEGDGQSYFITTVNCDGVVDYINDGDTQIAIYSGDCDAPVAVACNEDDPNRPPNEFPAALQLDTEMGTTYYMMIDGFDATALGGGPSDGEFCISVDQLTVPPPGDACADANDISGLFSQGLNNVQTSSIYDNTGYDNIGDPADGYECFGEPDGGAATPTLENTIWFTFVGDGESYFITTVNCDGVTDYINDGDTQIAIYSGDCDAPVAVACNEDDPNRPPNEFPAGLEFATEAGTTYYMMIDGFDATALGGGPSDGEFCITVDQLTAPLTSVNFKVDMTLEEVSAEGVFLSGSFNGWPNPGAAMNDDGDGTWSLTIMVEQNRTHEYKFQNGTDGWENDLPADCASADNNRFVEVGSGVVAIPDVCFNHCVTCDMVSDIIDPEFAAAIAVFPNPTSDQTAVQYNFETTVDLTINLVNTLGQVVKSNIVANALSGTHTIDVSDLATGMYILHMTDGERVSTQSLVVE